MTENGRSQIVFHVLTEEQARLVNERISDYDIQVYRGCQKAIAAAAQDLQERQREIIDCERDLRERYAPEVADDRPE